MPTQPADLGGIELAPRVWAGPDALRIQFSRSSGPGGQNVNKVNTKVDLWVRIDGLRGLAPDAVNRLRTLAGSRLTQSDEIHIAADAERTQEANRADAMSRLRELLIQAMHRPRKRRQTRPSRASKERRLESKKRRGEIKSARRSFED